MFRNALFVTLVLAVAVGCSSKEDDPVVVPPPWGASAIAVGDNGLIMTTGNMLTWTQVATPGITNTFDLDKVVKVPNTNRVIALANSDSIIDDTNAEIWYNDNGGNGTWLMASYGTTEANLDARHRETGADDDWDLNDIFFVDQYTGYAVGTNSIILWTSDGGLTWYDINKYQASFPVSGGGYLYIALDNSIVTTATDFVPGAAFTATGGATGTIISVYASYYFTASVSANIADTESITITGGTSGAQTIWTVNPALWAYDTETALSVYTVGGTTSTAIHTIYIGGSSSNYIDGMWKITSNAPATVGARTFSTVVGPTLTVQNAVSSVTALLFFNATTGIAATTDGIWTTTTGSAWTQLTGSDNEYFGTLVYSNANLASNGYVYALDNDYDPGRVAVTFTAPATWAFDTTGGWVIHATAANMTNDWVNPGTAGFLYGNKIFFMQDGQDDYTWCEDATLAVLNNTLWTDTDDTYLAGSTTITNPAAAADILTGVSGTLRHMAKR